MPPSQPLSQAASVKERHAQSSSGTSSPRPDARPTKRRPDPPTNPPRRVHYNLIIRLPFPRGDFVDPPQIGWDQEKDKRLWGIIATNAKIENWEEVANDFDVPLSFILQQSAWLYQRHMESVREQMRKVGASNAPTPTPGSQPLTAGGVAMKRLGSGGASRAPSQLSVRSRESPVPYMRESGPATPRPQHPGISRTPSSATVTQSRSTHPTSPRQPLQSSFRTANVLAPRKPDTATPPPAPQHASNASSPAESSSSSSSDEVPFHRSHIFRRPNPRFEPHKKSALGTLMSDEDMGSDDEESPTFLPSTKAASSTSTARADPTTIVRGIGIQTLQTKPSQSDSSSSPDKAYPSTNALDKGGQKAPTASPSTASSSRSAPAPPNLPAALSPRHRAELARLSSPRKHSRQGSDGTPSMGSSFSDLEDTSVTQSALEEELASNLRTGGASRLSSFGLGNMGKGWKGVGSRYHG